MVKKAEESGHVGVDGQVERDDCGRLGDDLVLLVVDAPSVQPKAPESGREAGAARADFDGEVCGWSEGQALT